MVLTREELIASLQHEVRVVLHLASKVDPARLDYRPTPRQRSTLELLQYLTEQAGFTGVQVLRLRDHLGRDPMPLLPGAHPLAGHLNPLIEEANVRFFGAPDYAIVARKAG